jgi:methylated-DNA-[protein]-cysteine S-methyltransferase
MPALIVKTPIGPLLLLESKDLLQQIVWAAGSDEDRTPLLVEAEAQLSAYFAGRLQSFDLPLAPAATPFQTRFREALCRIPFGQTMSYGDLARILGSAPRAVGTACAVNPFPVIIPCHRILAASGKLGGYSGGEGLPTKLYLLDFEHAVLSRLPSMGTNRSRDRLSPSDYISSLPRTNLTEEPIND